MPLSAAAALRLRQGGGAAAQTLGGGGGQPPRSADAMMWAGLATPTGLRSSGLLFCRPASRPAARALLSPWPAATAAARGAWRELTADATHLPAAATSKQRRTGRAPARGRFSNTACHACTCTVEFHAVIRRQWPYRPTSPSLVGYCWLPVCMLRVPPPPPPRAPAPLPRHTTPSAPCCSATVTIDVP